MSRASALYITTVEFTGDVYLTFSWGVSQDASMFNIKPSLSTSVSSQLTFAGDYMTTIWSDISSRVLLAITTMFGSISVLSKSVVTLVTLYHSKEVMASQWFLLYYQCFQLMNC